jgi:hypothetical protein
VASQLTPRSHDAHVERLFDAVKTPASQQACVTTPTAASVIASSARGGGGALPIAWGGEGEAATGGVTPRVERRSAALVMHLAEVRGWLQRALGGFELPAGDLPTLLQDGQVLVSLADVAIPGVAASLTGASPAIKLAGFASACRQLGVPEAEVLQPNQLLPGPERSAEALVGALAALAREASARKLLPPLDA